MIGINTNLGSLIIQSNLKKSTNALNTAIERMTTGFKINRAGDNAANYSISTNMSTEISAYQVAEDNANIGLEMLNTASNSLSLIDNALSRLRALAIQASNDTYGGQSLEAINSEANALIDEIEREYNSAEYNGIKLFQNSETSPSGGITADLINPVQQRDVSGMTALKDVDSNTTISSGTYSISSAEELAKLAEMTNAGRVTGGEFVLGADIDLSGYRSNGGWTPIGVPMGTSYNSFDGIFDGNGYVVSNLYINRPAGGYQGLFGVSVNGTFKNIALENVDITESAYSGGLLGVAGYQVGVSSNVTISNSYVTGTVTAQQYGAGGLVGGAAVSHLTITDSYFTGNVATQGSRAGGLVGGGEGADLTITGSYVLGQSDNLDGIFVGGIASSTFEISDSYYSSYYDGKGLEFVAGYGNQTSSGGATGGAASYNGGVPFTYSPSAAADTGTSQKNLITLQIGINSSESSQISIDTSFSPDNLNALRDIGTGNGDYVSMIDDLIKKVSAKQTELGATENRLVSALEEISIRYENLVSSRSTIRDADIAEVSSEYIRQQKGSEQPFFLSIAYMSPHDPRSMPDEYLRLYEQTTIALPPNFKERHPFDNGELEIRDEKLAAIPRQPEEIKRHIKEYYAMVSHVDRRVGDIIQALKDNGLYENSIIVFAGDNGLALGQHGLMGKQNVYEHSVNVPMLIKQATAHPSAEKRADLCYLIDLFPTLCDMAQRPIPASVDGVSLFPALQGGKPARDYLYYSYMDCQRAISDGTWKLIEYHVDGKRTTQLFNLQEDPYETTDLSAEKRYRKKIKELREQMLEKRTETHDTSPFWNNFRF